MKNELDTVRGVLASLAAAVRRAWTIRGIALTLAAAAAAALVSFGLDWFLDLPLAVRMVHLCVTLVALFLVARWALLVPLRTPMRERDLAEAVEHGAHDFADRLLSALDFEKRLADASEPESRELMQGVIRDAAASARRIDARLLVDSRPARRALAVAAVAILALAVTAFSAPDAFALWLRRGLLLSDIPWPRRTHLRLADFPETGPRIVTRGDDLRLVAVAEGDFPSDVTLHYEELSDPDLTKDPDARPEVTFADTRRMYSIENEPGRYAFDLRAVSASFRVWVTGGDDEDELPVYTVTALVPPRVASIAGKIVYPKYANLPDAEVRDASFDVLKGSRVELSVTANMPLASAKVVHADSPEIADVALGDDRRSMKLAFDVNESIAFHLALTAERGQSNRADDDVFRLRAAEDRAPDLRVLYPPARLYRTPTGIVPVKYIARDDFGVTSVGLELVLGSTPRGSAALWPARDAPPAPDARRVDGYRKLDLSELSGDQGPEVKAGDVLHLALRATDSNGTETVSSDLAVEILSPDDFDRRASERQGTLREELQIVRRNQQRARTAILDLVRNSAAGASASVVEQARNVEVDHGRVANDLAQFLTGIRRMFDSYVLNKVGDRSVLDKLLPIYDAELARPSEEEVFPASLYREIVDLKRLDKLYDSDILGALLDIQDLGDRASAESAPAVQSALTAWSGDAAHDPAHLERAEKAATDLAQLLFEIDQRMQRWGDLNLLIEMAREIRNTQESLSKDAAGTKGLAPK